jgi:glycosyltransferase involved in cell wall biosynthesis
MGDMSRIAIVNSAKSGGGAERSMNILAEKMILENLEAHVVSINESNDDTISQPKFQYSVDRPWNCKWYKNFGFIMKFVRIINKVNPDITIINCELSEFFSIFLIKCKKLVVVEHSHIPWEKRKLLGKVVRLILKKRNASFIAVSSEIKIWPWCANPKAIIPNLVADYKSSDLKKSSAYDQQPDTKIRGLVFIGRLSEEKGIWDFFDLCCETGLEGNVIGEGYLKNDLIREAQGKNLKIKFQGFLQNPWISIPHNHLLVIPSHSEGDGLVFFEALKNEQPLIVKKIPNFLRFSLPELNYAQNNEDFCLKINGNRGNIEKFKISSVKVNEILETRTPFQIMILWRKFLGDLIES